MTFVPITLADVAEPTGDAQHEAKSSDANKQPSQQAQPQHPSQPTAVDIGRWAADLPPITVETQSRDKYFREIINLLRGNQLPIDRQAVRRVALIAEHFAIVGNQLVEMANFQRKRR